MFIGHFLCNRVCARYFLNYISFHLSDPVRGCYYSHFTDEEMRLRTLSESHTEAEMPIHSWLYFPDTRGFSPRPHNHGKNHNSVSSNAVLYNGIKSIPPALRMPCLTGSVLGSGSEMNQQHHSCPQHAHCLVKEQIHWLWATPTAVQRPQVLDEEVEKGDL